MLSKPLRNCSFSQSDKVLIEASDEYDRLRSTALSLGYKHRWVYRRMVEKFGEEIARKICPLNFKDYDSPF